MQSAQGLKSRLDTAGELHSVVKTMKALAAVNIRHFERAAKGMDDYLETVLLGLGVVLGASRRLRLQPRHPTNTAERGLIVFGSDQGMCGSLNEQVLEKAQTVIGEKQESLPLRLVAVGERAADGLRESGLSVERVFTVPSGVGAIIPLVAALLEHISEWSEDKGVAEVHLVFTRQKSGASTQPSRTRLLPLDQTWLDELAEKDWSGPSLPMFTMPDQELFRHLLQEYLFAGLFRATAQSLAGENAMRLASMQGAEKNIEERIEELTSSYQQVRQSGITSELLDITSGFEAIGDEMG